MWVSRTLSGLELVSTLHQSARVLGSVQLVCKTSSDSVLGLFSVCLVF